MNPFDLTGPQFLAFYGVGAVLVALATVLIVLLVSRPPQPGDAAEIAKQLHPTEAAFLIGGTERAIEAAIAGLHHAGTIEIADGVLRPRAGSGGAASIQAVGVFRGIPREPQELSAAEQHVMRRLSMPSSVDEVTRASEALDSMLSRKLERLGLLVREHGLKTVFVLAPGLVWVVLGAIKLMVGISRSRPIGVLAVLVLVVGALVFNFAKAPRRTWLGNDVARLIGYRNLGLELTAKTAPAMLSPTDMMLAYAVFGPMVAVPDLHPLLPSVQEAAARDAASGSGSSSCGSSSSCSSSSCSSGSSCGGGGGGCGGCGGCS